MFSNSDSSALWAWSLTIIGILLSLSSLLGQQMKILLLCVGVALMLQAIPVWLIGQYLGRVRRRRALEFVEQIGGKIGVRLAADPLHVLSVDLSRTEIRNADLDVLCGLSALESLNLSQTEIDGEGVEFLSSLRRLHDIDLSQTRLGDHGLKRLISLPMLRKVQLGQTEITADGLADFQWHRADVDVYPRGLLSSLESVGD